MAATSPDQQLLAISSHESILIYNIRTKELQQKLDGCGYFAFRPTVDNKTESIQNDVALAEVAAKPAYLLVSGVAGGLPQGDSCRGGLTIWELDQHGRLIDEEEPIDADTLASQAIDAIVPQLKAEYEWSKDFIDNCGLHTDIVSALSKAAVAHRLRHNTVLEDASLENFGSIHFSNDGRHLLYHDEHSVVVYHVDAGNAVYRLTGHTDRIVWSGYSPNSEKIATISWDGTMRMFSASTDELSWVADMGGQCWSGAFSPDSKYIVWLSEWCRCFEWHPDGQQIAMCAEKTAYVWRPFDRPGGSIVQTYTIEKRNLTTSMAEVNEVSWMDEGRLLYLGASEGTKLVYDTEMNTKEIFTRRSDGNDQGAWVVEGFHGVFRKEDGESFYLSVDGDGKVRYWARFVTPSLPETEKEEKEQLMIKGPGWEEEDEVKKEPYVETGRYVQVTNISKGADREDWAEKGVDLWMA
ncbi:WD40 repeat-like protein [Massarina eburnea CBS 473.64]|uniref:WD40 repeat-like protein n=1 Tax=Massarina eburnea CBS 473.64 TaxID=1395130 RepID=A0A6A6S1H3_9PLEO|nr:WD40 repeat-like protein [Massarina eburnea CBS 473.64]